MEHIKFNENLMQPLGADNIIEESRKENDTASDDTEIDTLQHTIWEINYSPTTLKVARYMAHVIDRIRNGESTAMIAQDVDIPEATLCAWYKSREEMISELKTLTTTQVMWKLFRYNNTSSPSATNVPECNALGIQPATHASHAELKTVRRFIKVTVKDKLVAIERVRNGEPKETVARNIGIPVSRLRGWCKSEEKIRSQVLKLEAQQVPPSDRNIAPPLPAASMQINAENTVHPINKRANENLDAAVPRKRRKCNTKSTATTAGSNITTFADAANEEQIRLLLANNPALMYSHHMHFRNSVMESHVAEL